MHNTKMFLLLFLVLLLGGTAAAVPSALQWESNQNNVYAGGMAYDSLHNVIVVTGATYNNEDASSTTTSQCFVAVVHVQDSLEWIRQQTFGTTGVVEGCLAVTTSTTTTGDANTHTSALVVGTAEEGGLLTQLRQEGTTRSTQYGTILNFGFHADGSSELFGGYLLHDAAVQFPVSIVVDTNHEYVYTLSMNSENKQINADFVNANNNDEQPNLTKGGATPKFGHPHYLQIERLEVKHSENPVVPGTLQESLIPDWKRNYAALGGTVLASRLLELPSSNLLVVANTQGSGGVFEQPASSTKNWDGILLRLDATTGDAVEQTRIDSMGSGNDELWGACLDTNDNNNNVFYVVGVTNDILQNSKNVDTTPRQELQDDGATDAMLAQVDATTLQIQWSRQFRVAATDFEQIPTGQDNNNDVDLQALAVDCAVRNNQVVLVGMVQGGNVMQDASTNGGGGGGEDVFVALVDASSGNLMWMTQFGTPQDDFVRQVLWTDDDTIVLLGDTQGNLYRTDNDQQVNNVFLATVDVTTGHLVASGSDGNNPSPHSDPKPAPIAIPTNPPVNVQPPSEAPLNAAVPTTTSNYDAPTDEQQEESSGSRRGRTIFLIILIVLLAFAACICWMMGWRNQKQAEKATERAQVFAYLQSFDVEDVDLRHSATGGWHGTYVNNLAYGVNKADPSAAEGDDDLDAVATSLSYTTSGNSSSNPQAAPLTHSSIVRDSLFVTVDSTPALGGDNDDIMDDGNNNHRRGSRRSSAGYDGLVGAYQESWSSMGPRSYQDRISSLRARQQQQDDDDLDDDNLERRPWGKEII